MKLQGSTLGERLKSARPRDMSMESVAYTLGVAPRTVSRWERDETEPSVSQANELAKLYGVALAELLGEQN